MFGKYCTKCDGAIFHGSSVFFNGLGCVMLSQQMSPKSSVVISVANFDVG